MFNFKKEKVQIKLEGCLTETPEICKHGFGGICWHCEQEQKKKADENRTDFFNSFNKTINLDEQ